MKKYEILYDNFIVVSKQKLYRIRALKDFSNVKRGDLGGWVSHENNLNQTGDCWVYDKCKMFANSIMHDNAKMFGNAIMYDKCKMFDNSIMHDNAKMFDNSIMYDSSEMHANSIMYDNTRMYGSAKMFDNATLYEASIMFDDSKMFDDSRMHGNSELRNGARLYARLAGGKLSQNCNYKDNITVIHGSRHTLNIDKDKISVDCLLHTTEYWLENIEEIGNLQGYSKEQIEEYRKYIICLKSIIETN